MPSGYPEAFSTFSTPDTVDIADIDGMPLESGVDVTSCPDFSIAASMSVDLSASINDKKNCSLSIVLTAMDQKQQK